VVTLRNLAPNGTYVNEQLVVKQRVLAYGDRISFVEPCHARALGHILFRPLARALAPQPSARSCFGSLSADDVRCILAHLAAKDLVNARLVCTPFRDQSNAPAEKRRSDYLRTRALAAYAWKALPGYLLAETQLLWPDWQNRFDLTSASTALNLRCARSTGRTACGRMERSGAR
jgi:hypothetical protein